MSGSKIPLWPAGRAAHLALRVIIVSAGLALSATASFGAEKLATPDRGSEASAPRPPTPGANPQYLKLREHLVQLLDAKNPKDQVFVRWERPVRYYVQGLEHDPALMKLFEEQVAKIAKYTGLDIARHDDLYLEYRDEARNDRAKWPGGLSTNAAFFFSSDMEASFKDPNVVKVLKAFRADPRAEYLRWKKENDKEEYRGKLLIQKYGFLKKGLGFYFLLRDTSHLKNDNKYSTNIKPRVLQDAYGMATRLYSSSIVSSLLNVGAYKNGIHDLTEFDKAFLKALYSPAVKSGMSKQLAASALATSIMRDLDGR